MLSSLSPVLCCANPSSSHESHRLTGGHNLVESNVLLPEWRHHTHCAAKSESEVAKRVDEAQLVEELNDNATMTAKVASHSASQEVK